MGKTRPGSANDYTIKCQIQSSGSRRPDVLRGRDPSDSVEPYYFTSYLRVHQMDSSGEDFRQRNDDHYPRHHLKVDSVLWTAGHVDLGW